MGFEAFKENTELHGGMPAWVITRAVSSVRESFGRRHLESLAARARARRIIITSHDVYPKIFIPGIASSHDCKEYGGHVLTSVTYREIKGIDTVGKSNTRVYPIAHWLPRSINDCGQNCERDLFQLRDHVAGWVNDLFGYH